MKEFFDLECRYEDMSPVLIPAGYTRDYIDGKISAGEQLKDVRTAFKVTLAAAAAVAYTSSLTIALCCLLRNWAVVSARCVCLVRA